MLQADKRGVIHKLCADTCLQLYPKLHCLQKFLRCHHLEKWLKQSSPLKLCLLGSWQTNCSDIALACGWVGLVMCLLGAVSLVVPASADSSNDCNNIL